MTVVLKACRLPSHIFSEWSGLEYNTHNKPSRVVYTWKYVLTYKKVSVCMEVSYCNMITWYNNKAETHLWRKLCYSPEPLLSCSCSCTDVFWPNTLLKCYTWHVCPFREAVHFLRGWNHTYHVLLNLIIIFVPPDDVYFCSVCFLLIKVKSSLHFHSLNVRFGFTDTCNTVVRCSVYPEAYNMHQWITSCRCQESLINDCLQQKWMFSDTCNAWRHALVFPVSLTATTQTQKPFRRW